MNKSNLLNAIILIFLVSSSGYLSLPSHVFAQTVSSSSSNSTTSPNIDNKVTQYHPRDPAAYAAEKKHLDDITRAWMATHKQSPSTSQNLLTPSSPKSIFWI